MERDKLATRRKLIEAVGRVLLGEQNQKIGINTIAREAGVDKVMIYRYFGSLEKLLLAYAEDKEPWPTLPQLIRRKSESMRENTLSEIISKYLVNYLGELRRHHETQRIMRWGFTEKNALTACIEREREKQGKSLSSQLPFDQNDNPETDLLAIIALIHAGLTQLVLSAQNSDYYMGIDLKSARGWKRAEEAAAKLIQSYCSTYKIK